MVRLLSNEPFRDTKTDGSVFEASFISDTVENSPLAVKQT